MTEINCEQTIKDLEELLREPCPCGEGTECCRVEANALALIKQLTKKVEELENELGWATAYAVHYTSDECPNCGRMRVELYTNDKRVCEKCHWCIEENQYRHDGRL